MPSKSVHELPSHKKYALTSVSRAVIHSSEHVRLNMTAVLSLRGLAAISLCEILHSVCNTMYLYNFLQLQYIDKGWRVANSFFASLLIDTKVFINGYVFISTMMRDVVMFF